MGIGISYWSLIKFVELVRAYMLHISFTRKFRKQPKDEQVKAIISRSGIQLPKINIKNEIDLESISTTGEKKLFQSEESTKVNQEEQ